MKTKKETYKYCLVPSCSSTSIKFPNKHFFSLPIPNIRRRKWLQAMGRNLTDLSQNTCGYVCEDHFNLEEDLKSYMKYKYYPGGKVILKENVVPHIFTCQPDRTTAHPKKVRCLTKSLRKKRILSQLTSSQVIDSTAHIKDEDIDIELDREVEESMETETLPFPRSVDPLTHNKQAAAEALCSLSWSNYKQCNTLKIFISSTPDGLINFVSKGYGGRISDVELTKRSGYLESLVIHGRWPTEGLKD